MRNYDGLFWRLAALAKLFWDRIDRLEEVQKALSRGITINF